MCCPFPWSVRRPLLLQVLPDDAGHCGDACAGGVEGEQQGVASRVGCAVDHALDGAFGEDSCGNGVLLFRRSQSFSDVEGQVAEFAGEDEQAFDGGEFARLRGGCEVLEGVGTG